jgi:hypothetical protein
LFKQASLTIFKYLLRQISSIRVLPIAGDPKPGIAHTYFCECYLCYDSNFQPINHHLFLKKLIKDKTCNMMNRTIYIYAIPLTQQEWYKPPFFWSDKMFLVYDFITE